MWFDRGEPPQLSSSPVFLVLLHLSVTASLMIKIIAIATLKEFLFKETPFLICDLFISMVQAKNF